MGMGDTNCFVRWKNDCVVHVVLKKLQNFSDVRNT